MTLTEAKELMHGMLYSTPDSVCELLKTKITYEDGARMLDPCCGKGVTLSRMATAITTSYGMVLNSAMKRPPRHGPGLTMPER